MDDLSDNLLHWKDSSKLTQNLLFGILGNDLLVESIFILSILSNSLLQWKVSTNSVETFSSKIWAMKFWLNSFSFWAFWRKALSVVIKPSENPFLRLWDNELRRLNPFSFWEFWMKALSLQRFKELNENFLIGVLGNGLSIEYYIFSVSILSNSSPR